MVDEHAVLAILRGAIAAIEQLATKPANGSTPTGSPRVVATDADLDSQYGDEVVRFLPRDWSGQDFKGTRMSQCSPVFLDRLADSFAYFAQKNDTAGAKDDKGRPKSFYDRRSEGRARGWAARLRHGWKPANPSAAMGAVGREMVKADEIFGALADDDESIFEEEHHDVLFARAARCRRDSRGAVLRSDRLSVMKFKDLKLGATGQFPRGKLDLTDEGELQMALAAEVRMGVVRIAFGKPIAWVALPAHQARELAGLLIEKAEEVEKGQS